MAAIPIPGVNTPTYQTWGAAVAGKLNAVGWVRYSGTTDANGYVYIPPAQFGLTAVSGGVMVIEGAFNATVTLFVSECRPNAGNLAGRIVQLDTTSNDTAFALSYAVTVDAFAWGT